MNQRSNLFLAALFLISLIEGGCAQTTDYQSHVYHADAATVLGSTSLAPNSESSSVKVFDIAPVVTPGQPDPLEQYVRLLYVRLLRRTPSSSEVSGWVAQYDGGLTLNQMAMAFLDSTENRTNLVNSYAVQIGLASTSSPGGLPPITPPVIASFDPFAVAIPTASEGGPSAWVAFLLNNSEEATRAQFLGSSLAFANAGGNNRQWDYFLYVTVFQRPPDPTGSSSDQSALSQGQSRFDIANSKLFSQEYRAQHQIPAYYQKYLHRSASADEVAGWVETENGGWTSKAIQAVFLSCNEFITDAINSDGN